jgi:hypothetical protein
MNIRRFGIAATTAALALSLAACSGPDKPLNANGDAPAASPASSTDGGKNADGPDVKDGKDGIDWCSNVKASSFKDIEPYTAEDFADAYCDLITFNGENGLTDNLARTRSDYQDIEITFAKDFLTEVGQKALTKKYEEARANLKEGPGNAGQPGLDVNLLTGFAMENKEFSFADDTILAADRKWSPADYFVDSKKDKATGQPRIGLELTFTDDLLLTNKGKKVIVSRKRKMTVFMSPGGGEPKWLIDAWEGTLEYTSVKPYKAKG